MLEAIQEEQLGNSWYAAYELTKPGRVVLRETEVQEPCLLKTSCFVEVYCVLPSWSSRTSHL